MLDDLYEADTRAAVRDVIARPPRAQPQKRLSAWGEVAKAASGVRGLAVGLALDVPASVAEVVSGFGDVMGRIEAGESLQKRQVNMQSDFADAFRERAHSFAPDPNDTNIAEQAIYGISRVIPKAVAGTMVGGPFFGGMLVGLDEGLTQNAEMERAGVTDYMTRLGGSTAQGLGASLVGLPAVGTTVARNLGLIAASGLGFMGQQAITREILSKGGFEQQSLSYDPLDPLGIILSFGLPGTAAAILGPRTIRAANAAKIDRAVKSLPEYRDLPAADAAQAAASVDPPRASATFQSERTAVAAAVGRYPQEWEDAARVLLQAEQRRASNPGDDSLRAADAHEAALTRAEDQMARGDPVSVADMVRMPTAAESEANLRAFGAVLDDSGRPMMLYHGSPDGSPEFAGRDAYFTSSAAAAEGYTRKRGIWSSAGAAPTITPAYVALRNPLVINALGKRNDNIPVPWQEWKPKVFGNLPENAVSVADAVQYAKDHGHDGLIVRNVVDTADVKDRRKADVYVAFKPETQVKSAIGNSGLFDPTSASLTDTLESFARNLRSAMDEVEVAARAEEATDAALPAAKPADQATGGEATPPRAAEPAAAATAPDAAGAAADLQAAGLKTELTPERRAALQREVIDLRKRESLLRSLMDCLEA